ncbi:hypothetical protein PY365_12545, partial [Roseiarcaceae bacterium H3SJ34-1]|uniref:hypothetical protein n=1 Tax=Terripilifer ovatus TaxID=3032367 RepID=UPI003AB98B14|nr:hypothetical protein [Roseiarcaceae bacterium H3SJ34-1]
PHRVTSKPLTQGNHAEIVSANQYCQTFTPSEERLKGASRRTRATRRSLLLTQRGKLIFSTRHALR